MQTFLPYPDFTTSALCLDPARLGKQRVECLQIENVLRRRASGARNFGWANHPAVLLWVGHAPALAQYKRAIILEWIARGYLNTMEIPPAFAFTAPPWLGLPALHASHRAALLFKHPDWYRAFDWSEAPALDYHWPAQTQVARVD